MKPPLRAKPRLSLVLLALLVVLLLSACSQASAAVQPVDTALPATPPAPTTVPASPTPNTSAGHAATAAVKPPAATPVSTVPAASPTPTQPIFPTPCPETCRLDGMFPFRRPLPGSAHLAVDPSYRFGNTQNGAREPHHGVEFLNPAGTPVLAAGDGQVIVAGNDTRQLYGPYYNFYGNLVIMQHSLPGLKQPVFTLYAHLSEIDVRVGDQLQAGDPLGKVGMTGSATGNHLHFEVRLGENSYTASRNPELWLKPLEGQDGRRSAALAGRILYPPGYRSALSSVVVEQLAAPGGDAITQVYLTAYEENALSGQPPWEENFAASDLPPGWYRITFVQFGLQYREVQLFPGALTLTTFDLRSGP